MMSVKYSVHNGNIVFHTVHCLTVRYTVCILSVGPLFDREVYCLSRPTHSFERLRNMSCLQITGVMVLLVLA